MGAGPRLQCTECGDIIQSMFRHDYKNCKCGSIFIDGGDAYTRWGGISLDMGRWVDLPDEAEQKRSATRKGDKEDGNA